MFKDTSTEDQSTTSVFSPERNIVLPKPKLPPGFEFNKRLQMDGLEFLGKLPEGHFPVAFFDPQYRGILDKMSYGNEGKGRGESRCALQQMDKSMITEFVSALNRVLIPSGHLFLWVDKYELLNGFRDWLLGTSLEIVDMISWNKKRMGMGYRSRRTTEHCLVLQKKPRKAKGVWRVHNIPDTWSEKVTSRDHPHSKPIELQQRLIEAVTNKGDIVLDPAAGSFNVMVAAHECKRKFLGCDLNG